MRGRIGHLVEPDVGVVGVRVAGQVITRVVLDPGRAPVVLDLRCCLDSLRAGEQAAGRDAGRDERPVVRTAAERRRVHRQILALEVVQEEVLEECRTGRTGGDAGADREVAVVTVVDEPDEVRRADHVEIDHRHDLGVLVLVEVVDVERRSRAG